MGSFGAFGPMSGSRRNGSGAAASAFRRKAPTPSAVGDEGGAAAPSLISGAVEAPRAGSAVPPPFGSFGMCAGAVGICAEGRFGASKGCGLSGRGNGAPTADGGGGILPLKSRTNGSGGDAEIISASLPFWTAAAASPGGAAEASSEEVYQWAPVCGMVENGSAGIVYV